MTRQSTAQRNRTRSFLRVVACLACVISAPQALAAETQVYGKVLSVEPIVNGPVATCASAEKPASEDGLAALLTWDLQTRPDARRACRQQRADQVEGYRVTYAYAGREFDAVLPEHPGSRVPLMLELD